MKINYLLKTSKHVPERLFKNLRFVPDESISHYWFLRICATLGKVDSSKKDISCQFENNFCCFVTRRSSYAIAFSAIGMFLRKSNQNSSIIKQKLIKYSVC